MCNFMRDYRFCREAPKLKWLAGERQTLRCRATEDRAWTVDTFVGKAHFF